MLSRVQGRAESDVEAVERITPPDRPSTAPVEYSHDAAQSPLDTEAGSREPPEARPTGGRLTIRLNGRCVFRDGARAAGLTEEDARAAMAAPEIVIAIDLGSGRHAATVWTCDLS